jgi:hypothetical protein
MEKKFIQRRKYLEKGTGGERWESHKKGISSQCTLRFLSTLLYHKKVSHQNEQSAPALLRFFI